MDCRGAVDALRSEAKADSQAKYRTNASSERAGGGGGWSIGSDRTVIPDDVGYGDAGLVMPGLYQFALRCRVGSGRVCCRQAMLFDG